MRVTKRRFSAEWVEPVSIDLDQIGEHGVVDLMAVIGYFHVVAMMPNVDRYPLLDGVKAPLQALADAK